MDIRVTPSDLPSPAEAGFAKAGPSVTGMLFWPKGEARCALGRGGVSAAKREGDGATPVGVMALRYLFYRADREAQPFTRLPIRAIEPQEIVDKILEEAYDFTGGKINDDIAMVAFRLANSHRTPTEG